MDQWARDHAAGKHQDEIVNLMLKLDAVFHGHSRSIIIMALIRSMAGMLGPALPQTRENMLREIPLTIRNILDEMDRLMKKEP